MRLLSISLLLLVSFSIAFSQLLDNYTGFAFRTTFSANIPTTVYRILLKIDLRSKVSSGKILPNCGDLRFRRDNEGTYIPHFILNDCATSNPTYIWLETGRINAVASYIFHMLFFMDTWESFEQPWDGEWVYLSHSVCPAGWDRFEEMDGRLVKFMTTPGGMVDGGDSTNIHDHTLSGDTLQTELSTVRCEATSGNLVEVAAGYHKHDTAAVVSSDTQVLPPYQTYVMCKRKRIDFVYPEFVGFFTLGSPIDEYYQENHLKLVQSHYVRGGTIFGYQGGSSTHSHAFSEDPTSGPLASLTCNSGIGTLVSSSVHSHVVAYASTSLSSEIHEPDWYRIRSGEAISKHQFDNIDFSQGTRFLFTVPPPFGFTEDTTARNRYLRMTNGTTTIGGAPTHTHLVGDVDFTMSASNLRIEDVGDRVTVVQANHWDEHGPLTAVPASIVNNQFLRGEFWIGSLNAQNAALTVDALFTHQYYDLTPRVNSTPPWEAGASTVEFSMLKWLIALVILCCVL